MNLLLTGASGFAGGEVLRQALQDDAVERVTVLTRRPLRIRHAKLREVMLADFLDYSGLDLSSYDACIWCLGVSQSQVGEADYIRITHDYTVAAARALHTANPHARFCFVSGRSADPDERGGVLNARIKGRAEASLAAIGMPLHVFRPGYIKPSRISGPRRDAARWLAPIGTVISWLGEGWSVDCDRLAACLLDVARHGAAPALLDNVAIRRWHDAASVSQDAGNGSDRDRSAQS